MLFIWYTVQKQILILVSHLIYVFHSGMTWEYLKLSLGSKQDEELQFQIEVNKGN